MIGLIVLDLAVGAFALMSLIVFDLWRDTQVMHTLADIARIEAAWDVDDTIELERVVDDGDTSTCLTPCTARHCAEHRRVIAGELVDEPTVALDPIGVTAAVAIALPDADPATAEAPLRVRPAAPVLAVQRFAYANPYRVKRDFWEHRAGVQTLLGMWTEPARPVAEVFGPVDTGEFPIIGRPPVDSPTHELALIVAGAELVAIGGRR